MAYASLWGRNDITKTMNARHIQNYLHHLTWNDDKGDVLEVGCGEGSITRTLLYPRIKNHVRKLLATDKLEDMIEFARKENKIPEIDYQVLDVTDPGAIEKYPNQFDHIFSLLAAQLIPDNRRFFADLRRMLKGNGQIFVTSVFNNIMQRSLLQLWKEEKWKRYKPESPIFPDYTDDPEGYVRNILTEVGFKVDVCEHELKRISTENFKDFVRALVHMYTRVGGYSADIGEDFIQENIRNCIAQSTYLGEPDRYEAPCQQIICIATKID